MRFKILMTAMTLAAPVSLGGAALAEDVTGSVSVETTRELPSGLTIEQVTGNLAAAKDAKETRQVERVLAWADKDGRHVAVFATLTREGIKDDEVWTSKSLYVTSYLHDATHNKYTAVQTIRELVNPCNLDMEARFLDQSVTVTDLDKDGQAELTFGYVTRCAGDVSPSSKKVLMLEGKAKHALRGESLVDLGDGVTEGGSYRVDFKKAPKSFKNHAIQVWTASDK